MGAAGGHGALPTPCCTGDEQDWHEMRCKISRATGSQPGTGEHECYLTDPAASLCGRNNKRAPFCPGSWIEIATSESERHFSRFGFDEQFVVEAPRPSVQPSEYLQNSEALCPQGGFVLLNVGELDDDYTLRPRSLAWGTFGDVTVALHHKTGAQRAVKTVSKTWLRRMYQHLQESEVDMFVRREVEVLKRLDHPHIVRLYEAFDNQTNFRVVLELCEGGTLTSRIEPNCERLPEPEALDLFKQMLAAVHHLHSHGFVHRDLKPDNFMFAETASQDTAPSNKAFCLKLIDFGLARRLGVDTGLHASANLGTKKFKAPELASGGQVLMDFADRIDMWSLGVILYIIFAAELPRNGASEMLKEQRFAEGSKLGRVSAFGIDLLAQLLSEEPLWRPDTVKVMKHAWCGSSGLVHFPACTPSGFQALVERYACSTKLRRLALLAVAFVADDHDENFNFARQMYRALEFDCDGMINPIGLNLLVAAGLSPGMIATSILQHFEEIDIDGSRTITWTKFLSIFIKVPGTSLPGGSSSKIAKIPKVTISEDVCRRAFRLLSDGSDKIWAVTIGELFAPVKTNRVLNYETQSKMSSWSGFSHSMERDEWIREVDSSGRMDFDCFMRMLRTDQRSGMMHAAFSPPASPAPFSPISSPPCSPDPASCADFPNAALLSQRSGTDAREACVNQRGCYSPRAAHETPTCNVSRRRAPPLPL